MKKIIIISVFIFLNMITVPIICQGSPENQEKTVTADKKVMSVKSEKIKPSEEKFKVLLKDKNEIVTMDTFDYLLGCVSAEMPVSYEAEAIKAQTVAAYTYALYKKQNSNGAYDITDDYKTDQAYNDIDALKEKWGENYEKNKEIIESAVKSVIGKKLTYNGKPALTVYHSVSSGKTLSSKEIWGKDIPYLTGVDSGFDETSPNYIKIYSFTDEEMKNKLSDYLKTDGQKEIGQINRNENKVVNDVEIYGNIIKATDLQALLSLRSRVFDIVFENGSFKITAYGYGHGVGMSQYGANCMAKQGSSYKEILLHYYKGCKIE